MSDLNEVQSGVLRTPDACFENLPDFPFEAHYTEIQGLRVHFLDEGPRDGQPILLMHGEPSWCYLYRKMIPGLVEAGFRCIAPDLIGFGKSDKLVDAYRYTYAFHVNIMTAFVRSLEFNNIILFCQDWGSLIGLSILAENLDNFERLIVGNGGLPTGDHGASDAFKDWLMFSQQVPEFPVGRIVQGGCASELTDDVVAAYDAPFPSEEFKTCARVFPLLVPITPDNPESENNRQAWAALRQWEGPVLTLFSDKDAIMKGGEKVFQKLMPGAQGQPHATIQDGGHFLQEDQGEVIAEHIVSWLSQS